MALIIFWASLVAIFFFLLRIIFKGISDLLNSLLDSFVLVFKVGGIATLGCVVSLILLFIKDEGFWAVVGTIVLIVLAILFVVGVLGGILATIIEVVGTIFITIIETILTILEFGNNICENKYNQFLGIIKKEIEKI